MGLVRTSVVLALVGLACSAPAATVERRPHKSPDGRYTMHIDLKDATESTETVESSSIKGIRLVTAGSGKTVAQLFRDDDSEGNNFGGVKLVWSADSQWCAFYYSYPRMGTLQVFHRVGARFVRQPSAETLRVSPSLWLGRKADVRNEYLEPLRWLAPGRLLIEQFSILRGEDGSADVTLRLTAQNQKGRFRVVDVKDSPAKRALP